MAPAVSVILATFNRLHYLREAVASVFAQTFTDWELVIADDGSAPATLAYLESLDDPRVRLIRLDHTGVPAVARNAALRQARAEWVAFLDSDDLWHPRKLERQRASLRCHPECGWGYTRFTLVNGAGGPYTPKRPRDWPALSGSIVERLIATDTVIALPSVVVSRALIERVGLFDEQLLMCEDYELWLRLAAASDVDAVDEPLTMVRRHAEHSGDDVTAWRDRLRVIERAFRNGHDGRLGAVLQRVRTEVAAGLAVSQASSGLRVEAFGTLLAAAPHSWSSPRWWRGAVGVAGRAGTPRLFRRLLRRLRRRCAPT